MCRRARSGSSGPGYMLSYLLAVLAVLAVLAAFGNATSSVL
jgi:Tfp pilus assembly protein FimT